MTAEHSLASHVPIVLRFFLNKVANPSDADDCTQQTFERMLARAEHERVHNPGALLLGIARNVLHEYWRALARRRQTEDIGELSIAQMGPGMSTIVNVEQWKRLMYDALRTLRLDHQTVLELYYWEGKKYREIAEVLEVPIGTVSSWLLQGKTRLYEQLRATAERDGTKPIEREELERRLTKLTPES